MTNNIKELTDKLNKLNDERKSLFEEQQVINKKLTNNYDEIEDIKDTIFKIKYANLTTEDIMSFDWNDISGEAYVSCRNFLRKNYEFLYFGGYVPEAENQIQTQLSKPYLSNEELDKLKSLIPLIKESTILGNKGKYIGILGGKDSWYIKLDLSSFKITNSVFKTINQFSSLEDMLEYVYKSFFVKEDSEDY